MAALPYMPLYVADYMADTSHLTTTEHGAYMLLLMAMWRSGGALPNDDVRLSRVARLPLDKWRRMAPTILALMTVENGFVSQGRLVQELQHSQGRVAKRREAGKAGFRAKSLKNKDADQANATAIVEHCLSISEPYPEGSKEAPNEASLLPSYPERLSAATARDGLLSGKPPPRASAEKEAAVSKPAEKPSRVFVAFDTPEWAAWSNYLRAKGKTPYAPDSKFGRQNGWWFPSEKPPNEIAA